MGELTGAMRALKNVKEAELIGMPKLKKCVLMGGLKNVESVKMENAGKLESVKGLKEVRASHQQELESTRKVVQELRGQLARLSTSKSDCERVVRRLEEESAALQNEYAATSELLQQKRQASEALRQRLQNAVDAQEGKNKKAERKAVVRRLQGLFPEVKGLLVDLVNATQRKWGCE